MPRKTPPISDIKGMNKLNPDKRRIRGKKQVKSQAEYLFTLKSYIKIFFNNKPVDMKAINVVITPIERAKE